MAWNLIIHLKSKQQLTATAGANEDEAKEMLRAAQQAVAGAADPATLVTLAGTISVRPSDIEALEVTEEFLGIG